MAIMESNIFEAAARTHVRTLQKKNTTHTKISHFNMYTKFYYSKMHKTKINLFALDSRGTFAKSRVID